MKKILAAALVASAAFSANAVVIWDNLTNNTSGTTTTSTPRFLTGDALSSIADPGTGNFWQVDSVDFKMFIVGAQTFAAGELTVQIRLWNVFDPAATGATNAFSDLAGTISYSMGARTTTGNTLVTVTGATVTPFALAPKTTNFGIDFGFFRNGVKTEDVVMAYKDTAPVVGTSPNGFFRDMNNDGLLQANEATNFANTTNTNAMVRINATPVPEPATLLALAAGAGALISRRRRSR